METDPNERDAKPLRLDHFLKLAGFVDTGGQAKMLIQSGEVLVNGQLETRRRRQLQPGDVIQLGEYEASVELEEDDEDDSE
ncbi:MAG: RNA-binding S4 domain-containing protein [Rubinisphaera brasiliensis]|uniref:RNA-binding S4 domain protein n=1 Tax=Rubinisphaera brasiliensis (strain ATCC 49424 / DSM 5305 / JCM 21570 / IAM 15109 / NBRC 103401 / IFAM 1448) TaxID=756272 RepID=F0SSL3_RUBBR|nr:MULTISPECIES: RNA-binding S4 domain-containing protein [Rubinisphaera]ADY60329.1 RNA-binding S4 domain protein [Rubinisphaera brasiliensis DSM 5305]MBB02138.1 ribosome-associated protein [Planctomyces sp.]MBR9803488.1 RNA-binding S4 domain-containing protein [bacterium]